MNIGQDISVTVLGTKGNQVRIGIEAPADVGVHRSEIFEKIKREEARKNSQSGGKHNDHSTYGQDYLDDMGEND